MPTVAVCIGTCWTTAQIQRTQVPCMSHVEKHVDIVMLQVEEGQYGGKEYQLCAKIPLEAVKFTRAMDTVIHTKTT